VQDKWIKCTINDVIYIPGGVNLFSEGVLHKKGFTIVRKNNKTVFYKEGKPGPQAEWSNGCDVIQTCSETKITPNTWHNRLTHINMGSLRESVKKGRYTYRRAQEG
jgi:hypothetical protein